MSKNKEILLSVRKLNTKFINKKNVNIVHKNLDLDIYEGECLSIIGSNGAGKTVLVETIIGIRKIQSGEIIPKKGFDIMKDSGMQFQTEDDVSTYIRPINLIKFYKKIYSDKVIDEEVDQMIDIFGVRDLLNIKFKKMSGGQRQRVNLLLSIISKPRLLILDEFTTGLDITTVIDILEYIINLSKKNNMTLVIVTHSAKEIKILADRVVLIRDGIIKMDITTSEIKKKYNNDFDEFLIESIRRNK